MNVPGQGFQKLEHHRQTDRCDQRHYHTAFTDINRRYCGCHPGSAMRAWNHKVQLIFRSEHIYLHYV